MARIKSFRLLTRSLLTATSFIWLSSAAQAQGGEMDSVWSDQQKTTSKSQATSDSKTSPNNGGDATQSSAEGANTANAAPAESAETQASMSTDTTPPLSNPGETGSQDNTKPAAETSGNTEERPKGRGESAKPRGKKVAAAATLCTIDTFAKSALVSAGLWPGVGPFRVAEDAGSSQLVDDAKDTIKLKTNRQRKVTGVEMQLTGRPARDFLGLEMTSDFLLEALGTRPARIADFNTDLEKIKTKVLTKGTGEQNLTAGRYLVFVKPTGKTGFNIIVNNGEASADSIRDHAAGIATSTTSDDDNSTENVSDTRRRLQAMLGRPTPPADATRNGDTGATKVRKGSTPSAEVGATPAEGLKGQFQDLIQNWQQVKKVAVKTRDTSELSKVLSGKALDIQTNGVKWLAKNHKYYDMQPMGVDIGNCTELIKGKKYSVMAKVKELSKFYDETNNALLRSQQDTYNVNYTVEKVGDHFVISDSSIVHFEKPPAPQAPVE